MWGDFLTSQDLKVFSFSGVGEWKEKISKKQGKYSLKIKTKKSEQGLRLTENYSMEGDTNFTSDLLLQLDGLGFVTVYDFENLEEAIGYGVCFRKNLNKKVCKLSYSQNGMSVEKTYKVSLGKVKRMGIVKNENFFLAFTDSSLGSVE